MKLTKLSAVAVFAISSTFAGGTIVPTQTPIVPSDFSASANMAIASNYVWRGMTQTANSVAIQGGIDLGYKGFYLGTWGSNVEFGGGSNVSLEADLYAGYASEFFSIDYDIAFTQYAYPHDSDALNFEEVSLGLSKDFDGFGLNSKYSFGLDDASDYWEAGTSVDLPMDVGFSASYGDYADIGSNYIVSLSKEIAQFEVSLAYTAFQAATLSGLEDEDHILATISAGF